MKKFIDIFNIKKTTHINIKDSKLRKIKVLNYTNSMIIIILFILFINNFNQIVSLVKQKMRTQTTQMLTKSAEQENLLIMEEVETWYQNCLGLAASCTDGNKFSYGTARRITNAAEPVEECVLLTAYDIDGNGYISAHKDKINWDPQTMDQSVLDYLKEGRIELQITNKSDEKLIKFMQTRDDNNMYDYEKYLDKEYSDYIVTISVPVFNNDKQVVGGVSGYYDASKLIQILGKDTSLTAGNTIIFNSEGVIIAYRDKRTVDVVINEFELYKDKLKAEQVGNMFEKQNEHLFIVFQYNRVSDWIVAKVAQEEEISEYAGLMTKETKELLRKNLILMIIVISLVIYLYLRVLQMEKYVRNKMEEELDSERILRSYLENRVRQDSMTGLFHKNAAQEMMNQVLNECNYENCAFYFIDIDNFKTINDTYGHARGDYVIHKVTHSMREIFPEEAIIGRYGGDEFIILLKYGEDVHTVCRLAKELCEKVNHRSVEDRFSYSISIGIAISDSETNSLTELKNKADEAMYQAKKEGKNGYSLWS